MRPSAADAAPPPRAGVRVENRPEDVLRAQAIMRNILLALLALCFGAATAAKQALDDKTIRVAVRAWFDDRAAAEAEYGHISTWETGGVTDISWLFCVRQDWMDNDDQVGD